MPASGSESEVAGGELGVARAVLEVWAHAGVVGIEGGLAFGDEATDGVGGAVVEAIAQGDAFG